MSSFFVSNTASSAFPLLPSSTAHTGDEDKLIPREPLTEEKIKSTVPIPAFLPYYDLLQNVGETIEMRLAYRQMLHDPNVKAAFFAKLFAVMGQDLSVRPTKYVTGRSDMERKKCKRRNKVVAEFVEWNLKHATEMGVPGLIWEIFSGGMLAGYSVCEKVWDEPEEFGRWKGKRPLRKLKSKDVDQDLVPYIDAYSNITAIKGLRYNAGQLWNPQEFVIYKNLSLYGNPLGMSDFRAAYGSYWMLDTCLKIRAMACEKRTLPIVWATYQQAQAGQQKTVEEALNQLRYRNWIAVPEGVKLDVLETARQADAVFDSYCKAQQERIFLAIAGATLQAVQGGQGTMRGSSAVHKDTADLFKWFIQMAMTHVLNDRKHGLIPDIVNRNFAAVEDYPYASLSGVDDTELAESLRVDQGLAQIIQPAGYQLNMDQLSEKYARRFEKAPEPPPQPGEAADGADPDLSQVSPDQAQQMQQLLGG